MFTQCSCTSCDVLLKKFGHATILSVRQQRRHRIASGAAVAVAVVNAKDSDSGPPDDPPEPPDDPPVPQPPLHPSVAVHH